MGCALPERSLVSERSLVGWLGLVLGRALVGATGLCVGLFGRWWWGFRLAGFAARGMVTGLRRALDREILRQRMVDLLRAEPLAEPFVGPSRALIAEIRRLADVLADGVDDRPTLPGWEAGRPDKDQARRPAQTVQDGSRRLVGHSHETR